MYRCIFVTNNCKQKNEEMSEQFITQNTTVNDAESTYTNKPIHNFTVLSTLTQKRVKTY